MQESSNAKDSIPTIIIIKRKLVPQRGCWVGNFWAFNILSVFPDSKLYTILCSAPWYWNKRCTSLKSEINARYDIKKKIRNNPEIKLNSKASWSLSNSQDVIPSGAAIKRLNDAVVKSIEFSPVGLLSKENDS